ncbi:ADP-ribosylhydrolase ARH3 isoform X2 [Parasteatoda tepidariorum]|uniref:ADP-ribosylhydrolase ARH3 isoform X2 n=1 Tax=Parasteatoda tepidariorum TaxID=114398 RepID=UPI0039BCFA4E
MDVVSLFDSSVNELSRQLGGPVVRGKCRYHVLEKRLLFQTKSEPILPYTDDTAMTISVAQSLIENKEICPADLAEKFVNEFFENPSRRYGMNAARIFKNLQESEFEDVFLPAKTSFSGTGSAGNGAAMRVAPIALFAHDKEEEFIKGAVEQCSFITHTHPDGYNGAILMCLAVHSALKLDSSVELDPIQFISDLEDKMKKIETKVDANDAETGPKRKDSTGFRKVIDLFTSRWTAQQEEETPYCSSLKKIKNIFLQKQDNISNEEVAEHLGNNVLALRSVPVAIYSFLKSLKPLRNFESTNPFVRAMYFAISVGGDTDTIASMTGSIAGAYYGIDEIPHNLQRRCEKIDEVVKLADDLLKVSQA